LTDPITGEGFSRPAAPFEGAGVNESAGNGSSDPNYGFGDHQGFGRRQRQNLSGVYDQRNGRAALRPAHLDRPGRRADAAGPRIDSSRSSLGGPITGQAETDLNGNTVFYNNTTLADGSGTPVADGFVVNFDRPIDPSTFTAANITVYFHDTLNPISIPPGRAGSS